MKPLWRCRRGWGGRGETFERGGWGCRLRGCAHHVFAGRSVTSEAGGDGTLQTARGRESTACGSAVHAAAALCSAPPARQPAFAAAAGYKTHTCGARQQRAAAAAPALSSRRPATRTPSPSQRDATSSHRQARRPAARMPSPPSRTWRALAHAQDSRRARSRGAAAAAAGGAWYLLLAIAVQGTTLQLL